VVAVAICCPTNAFAVEGDRSATMSTSDGSTSDSSSARPPGVSASTRSPALPNIPRHDLAIVGPVRQSAPSDTTLGPNMCSPITTGTRSMPAANDSRCSSVMYTRFQLASTIQAQSPASRMAQAHSASTEP
jgi:hypothetical protein